MIEVAIFMLGVCGVSVALTYAVWTKLRVLILRQELLDIRDDLFDKAVNVGGLTEPAYTEAREFMNDAAAIAEDITWQVMYMVTLINDVTPAVVRIRSDNEVLQAEIDNAYEKVTAVVARHLVRRSLSGMIAFVVGFVRRTGTPGREHIERATAKTLNSETFREFCAAKVASYQFGTHQAA